jgi:hypothetical protein
VTSCAVEGVGDYRKYDICLQRYGKKMKRRGESATAGAPGLIKIREKKVVREVRSHGLTFSDKSMWLQQVSKDQNRIIAKIVVLRFAAKKQQIN